MNSSHFEGFVDLAAFERMTQSIVSEFAVSGVNPVVVAAVLAMQTSPRVLILLQSFEKLGKGTTRALSIAIFRSHSTLHSCLMQSHMQFPIKLKTDHQL